MDEKDIKKLLAAVPGTRRGANGVIFDTGDGNSFYVTRLLRHDPDISPDEEFYAAFCTKKEIIRLREIKTPHDYLLRFRANAIADSARLTRVMLARRQKCEESGRVWSLSGYYDTLTGIPKQYIARLPRWARKATKSIPFGFAPLAEVNAICLKSLVGEVIIVSEALRYFYYFMTICVYGINYGVDFADCVDAGIIAVRLMKGTEAQDFEIDPRGLLPSKTEAAIQHRVDAMIEFTFGHEYGHCLLNHVPAAELPGNTIQDQKTFSHSQEYAADLHAVKIVQDDRKARTDLGRAGYDCFLYLHIFESLADKNSEVPRFSASMTHPSPVDRMRALRRSLGDRDQPAWPEMHRVIKNARHIGELLLERIQNSGRSDLLTVYGSIYLHGLGGRPRRDRIDY